MQYFNFILLERKMSKINPRQIETFRNYVKITEFVDTTRDVTLFVLFIIEIYCLLSSWTFNILWFINSDFNPYLF